jgi:hypothetical protein
MGCLNVKSHQTTYQTLEKIPSHTIPYLNISSYLEFMYRSYIYISSYAVVFKSYIDHVSSNETLLKPSKGVSKVYRLLHHISEKNSELKPRLNHLEKLLSHHFICKDLCNIKSISTVLDDGDGGRDSNTLEKILVPYLSIYLWVQNKSHFCGFISQ